MKTTSKTIQNLLCLLWSTSEKSVALGLEIHKNNSISENTTSLNAYQQLCKVLFDNVLEAEHLVRLNAPKLHLNSHNLEILPAEVGKLTQLQH